MASFVFLSVCGDGQTNAKQAWYVHRLRSWECVYKISNDLEHFVKIKTSKILLFISRAPSQKVMSPFFSKIYIMKKNMLSLKI